MSPPIRVAIIGGGCAGIATAFELTRPEHAGRYQVTLYQRGHRLGGKGASGRGPHGRIEEHGLHLWMGYYENAFRLMRECYAELGRDPESCPIASWRDAFVPAHFVATADPLPSGDWTTWKIHFPALPGEPGDPVDERRPMTVADYVSRLLMFAFKLLESAWSESSGPLSAIPAQLSSEWVVESAQRLLALGVLASLGAVQEALRVLERAVQALLPVPDSLLLSLLDFVRSAAAHRLESQLQARPDLRRVWSILDIVLATVRGSLRHRLLTHPRGFEALDDYDVREWLLENGASRASIDSSFVRALYDLAFAYEDGDVTRPRIAAGAGMRGFLRAFFTYRGAFFWKMSAGMGDVVFAPMYELLKRRGVRFEFFHQLERVELAKEHEPAHVTALHFQRQAFVREGEYQPLVVVKGLPCFPSEPDYAQLHEQPRTEAWQFEWQADRRQVERRTLRVSDDFDLAVLAVGVGAIPHCCGDLLERDARWRAMVEQVRAVPTQAFQLWLSSDMKEFGWDDAPVSLCGFVEPFDTWADMGHLLRAEDWPHHQARAIAYFCSVMPAEVADDDREEARRLVRASAIRFLNRDLVKLWPRAHEGDAFRWELLAGASDATGEDRFDTQFWSANVDPSERYTLSLPGSLKYRISPLDRSYDNLTIAGDWTDCGLNLGCVEAAIMSGQLAAHALSGYPLLKEIVGYDHP